MSTRKVVGKFTIGPWEVINYNDGTSEYLYIGPGSVGGNMSQEEHDKLVHELEKSYIGKTSPSGTTITGVLVDFRYNSQHMNRVIDEDGNIYFLNDLEVKND